MTQDLTDITVNDVSVIKEEDKERKVTIEIKEIVEEKNTRDTQFKGFAKLLWDELETAIHQDPGFIPEGDHRRSKYIPVWQEIIARHAYDLAKHILDHAPMTEYECWAKDIPDMTAWPRTP